MTTALNHSRRTRVDIPEQTRMRLTATLNASLATAIDLKLQAKQAHWNVGGMEFSSVHEFFDRIAGDVEEASDLLAERILQLGGTAYGTSKLVAERSILGEYPHHAESAKQHLEALTESIAVFSNHVREAIASSAELGDATTSDIYTEISRTADKNLWMLEAHLR